MKLVVQGYAWVIHRLGMDYERIIHGCRFCKRSALIVRGTVCGVCTDCVWPVYGLCVDYARAM